MAKRKRRHDATGRSTTERFVKLDYGLLRSAAYRRLSPRARALLVEVALLYDGSNNGRLGLGVRAAATALGSAPGTAGGALRELEQAGFICATRKWLFDQKSPEARTQTEWRATWLPTANAGATRDFNHIAPVEKKNRRYQKLTRDVSNIDTESLSSGSPRIKNCYVEAGLDGPQRIKNWHTYNIPRLADEAHVSADAAGPISLTLPRCLTPPALLTPSGFQIGGRSLEWWLRRSSISARQQHPCLPASA